MTSLETRKIDHTEIRPCGMCGKGIGHGGDIHFFEVTITQCIVDAKNIDRMAGAERMIGNVALARIFSPDNTVAHALEPVKIWVCAPCSLGETAILSAWEKGNDK